MLQARRHKVAACSLNPHPAICAEGSIGREIDAYWTPEQRGCGEGEIFPAAVRDVDAVRAAFSKSLAISFGRRKGVSGKRRASFSNFAV